MVLERERERRRTRPVGEVRRERAAKSAAAHRRAPRQVARTRRLVFPRLGALTKKAGKKKHSRAKCHGVDPGSDGGGEGEREREREEEEEGVGVGGSLMDAVSSYVGKRDQRPVGFAARSLATIASSAKHST
jgi:hypothetical protein